MKNLFLTFIMAALLSVTGMAQQQEQSSQYRTNKKSTERLSKQRRDSTMNSPERRQDTTESQSEDVQDDSIEEGDHVVGEGRRRTEPEVGVVDGTQGAFS